MTQRDAEPRNALDVLVESIAEADDATMFLDVVSPHWWPQVVNTARAARG